MRAVRKKRKIVGSSDRPRLVVFRSLKYIYAQVVDDSQQKTLFGVSSKSKAVREEIKKAKTPTEASRMVGKLVARIAKDKKIEKVVFDRNGYAYHGRVKALAEGAREGGLQF